MNKTCNSGEKWCAKRHGGGSRYKKGAAAIEKAEETKVRQKARKEIEEALVEEESPVPWYEEVIAPRYRAPVDEEESA